MHKNVMLLAVVVLLSLTANGVADGTLADGTLADQTLADETLAVELATNQFYSSLNALLAGDARGMDEIWSHADNVTYMGPAGGIAVGWDQVRATWKEQAEMKLGGHVEPMDLHVTAGNDLAIVECYELGSTGDAQGRPRAFRIRATSSLRKENGQWKMVGHHTDLLDDFSGGPDTAADELPSNGSNQRPDVAPDDDSIDVSNDEVILNLER